MRYRLRQPVEQYEFAPPVRFSPGLTGVTTISMKEADMFSVSIIALSLFIGFVITVWAEQ